MIERSMISKSFQSTLPVRGATGIEGYDAQYHDVSIHAPRERSDSMSLAAAMVPCCFNPRSP